MRGDAHEEPKRIVVTGVGGAAGFDLARSLMRLGCEVIATATYSLARGLLLPGVTPRTTPPADHPDFGTQLLGLCRELRPDALVPTVEQELAQLVRMRESLDALGVRTWLPDTRAVAACVDKAQFHEVLTEHGIPTPRTFLPHEIDEFPDGREFVVKPRRGYGAKDVHFCWTKAQARTLCELVPAPIVQERIEGREFTADCLVDRDGRASVILRYRLLVNDGMAMVSETFHDQAVTDLVRQTVAAVGAAGVCCAQGFIVEDGGHVVMTEMNARLAGGFPLAEASGADLVGQMLNGLFGHPVNHDQLAYKPQVRLTKYIETLAVDGRA
ncbi:ATP-grasp domain-containing protein [Streptomyces sp. NPDC059101]|uniref:ATP-grasp domain-containing protein n=1 Tax=Streptomyces sp. NPDC059101 TaxID=3346728 RepID=UPI0036804A71